MYNVPAQDKSLAGILSASEVISGTYRDIGEVPSYVTGPASRACGACHRATLINEDNAGELMSLNQHTEMGGYLIEAGEDPQSTLLKAIDEVMANFK